MWAGAEALGFEPRWRLPTPSGFQDRRNRPLCQTSISTRTVAPSVWCAAISRHGAGGGIRTLTDDVQLILSQWRLPIPPHPHGVNHHTTISRSHQQNHIGTDLRRTYAGRTMLRNAGAQSERTGATLALLRPAEAARGAPPHRCRDRVLTGSFHQTFRKLEFNQTRFPFCGIWLLVPAALLIADVPAGFTAAFVVRLPCAMRESPAHRRQGHFLTEDVYCQRGEGSAFRHTSRFCTPCDLTFRHS